MEHLKGHHHQHAEKMEQRYQHKQDIPPKFLKELDKNLPRRLPKRTTDTLQNAVSDYYAFDNNYYFRGVQDIAAM